MSHRTLYEITGDIKDVNTLLIPRSYFGEIQMQLRYNLWCPYKGSPDPWVVWKACESYIKDGKVMLLVHIKPEDVSKLEEIFAILTEDGWVLPQWLIELRKAIS